MNDAVRVRRVQRVGNLNCQRQQRPHLQRTPRNPMLQPQPIEKLHRNESFAVCFANVVNRANVGMIQRRRRLRLHLKTRQGMRVPRNLRRQKLERDKPVQPRVLRLVHDSHPAPAEFFDNTVMRDGPPDHVAESYVGESGKSTKGSSAEFESRMEIYFHLGENLDPIPPTKLKVI